MKKILLGAAAALVMGISGAANAEIVRLPYVTVADALLNDGSSFGGCLARINFNVANSAPSCKGAATSYVAFSCTGDLQNTETAEKLFEIAQMALLTGKKVRFEVDTNRMHNGYCMVTRAELSAN
ncbi:hypothetical protein ORJ04_21705 [Rheinheimera baltica]|uniref:Uncharacterized protein n=1 Tax=Rheinheimera baltica TaxID=67576 RepID=A0ABT9I578_9GAMM|nr:hypothetical protein [Rheinheimera baltica]MDP5138566.1 hypothetical protein [Rheinheimera baltica]